MVVRSSKGLDLCFRRPMSALPEGLAGEARQSESRRRARGIVGANRAGFRITQIRADVAGTDGELMSYGSSGIVDPDGKVVQEASLQTADLLVVDFDRPPLTPLC